MRFTLFWLAWIIASSQGAAGQNLQIDEDGNIILRDPSTPPRAPETPPPSPPTTAPTEVFDAPATEINRPLPQTPEPETRGFSEAQRARVTTRLLEVLRSPSTEGDRVVLLRMGDEVEVTGTQGDFSQVRYWIDGEFPVDGWALTEALQTASEGREALRAQEPGYTPESRSPEFSESVASLPDVEFPKELQLPEDGERIDSLPDPKMIPPATRSRSGESMSTRSPPARLRDGPWKYSAHLGIGWSEFSESLRTKTEGVYEDDNFLDYQLEGIAIQAQVRGSYSFEQIDAGLSLDYQGGIYDSNVGGPGTSVVASSVQAQLHDIRLGPYASRKFSFTHFRLEPELRVPFGFQIFQTNQLREASGSFPVLLNHQAFYGTAELALHAELPLGFSIHPWSGWTLFYSFSESPTQEFPEGLLGTGSPQGSAMNWHWGGRLAWSLERLGFSQGRLFGEYTYRKYSKKFSGVGNRAAMEMEDVRGGMEVRNIALGMEYLF